MFYAKLGAFRIALEKPTERLIYILRRTNNRIRSPRLAASGQSNKVGKGSRQISSVTSGKGMALRLGCGGLSLDVPAEGRALDGVS